MQKAVVLFFIGVFLSVYPSCAQGATSCDLYNGGDTPYKTVTVSDCNACQTYCVNDCGAACCDSFIFHNGNFATEQTSLDDNSACSDTASGVGDPHFAGFNGYPFEYNGHDGAIVNIYSDASLQVNAELSSFGIHDTTFMKSIGVKTYPPCNSFKFTSVATVENITWIAHVESHTNGEVYDGSGEWTSAEGGVALKRIPTIDGSFEVMLSTPLHQIRVRKERMSLHLDLGMKLLTTVSPLSAHGILGQTLGWTAGGQPASLDESSFIVSGIFENDFAFNKFQATCG